MEGEEQGDDVGVGGVFGEGEGGVAWELWGTVEDEVVRVVGFGIHLGGSIEFAGMLVTGVGVTFVFTFAVAGFGFMGELLRDFL